MLKKILFLYNSTSGDNQITDYFDEIISLYQDNGYYITLYKLCFDSRDSEILSSTGSQYEYLLIAGGDGSINYVVNLMKSHGVDIPVAILPAGTANDFAALLGMPQDIMECCRGILGGEVLGVDLGVVNDKYFVNVFSSGLFTDVSQKTPTIWKNNIGKLAYYLNGIGDLPKFRKMELSINSDGGDWSGKAILFFVFNGRTAGTLPIAYLSERDDGLLDVLILKGDNPFNTMRTAMEYLPRKVLHKDYPVGIVHLRCRSLHAEVSRNEHTDIDGQSGPSFPVDIHCEHCGLKVVLPKKE